MLALNSSCYSLKSLIIISSQRQIEIMASLTACIMLSSVAVKGLPKSRSIVAAIDIIMSASIWKAQQSLSNTMIRAVSYHLVSTMMFQQRLIKLWQDKPSMSEPYLYIKLKFIKQLKVTFSYHFHQSSFQGLIFFLQKAKCSMVGRQGLPRISQVQNRRIYSSFRSKGLQKKKLLC